ncbi:MAG: glycoside hydrolase family 15 protein [Proteobacteria bacterium]|nr:glycoside hydrolase family 15 protein [Pseudomonadota bacterium]
MSAQKIDEYALIGDCETAALVGRNGSIDWLCWPRFDSGACFAALLGREDNGRWIIEPAGTAARTSRAYEQDTLILRTRFEAAEGSVDVVDFMPLRSSKSDIVRLIIGITGRVRMRTELVLRFDYGALVPWVTRVDEESLRAIAGPDMVVLRSPVAVHGHDFKTVAEFDVAQGETVPFVLTYAHSHEPPPPAIDWRRALHETRQFWKDWCSRCGYDGAYRAAVIRSLITLKALTNAPTGGIIAAPTTSLPEAIGGNRNWDYRYCWLRDATFTLLTLMSGGFYEEAAAWRDWLLRAAAGMPDQVQIMYGVAGERRLDEWEVHWLAGYEGSKPVRIGNAASTQLQVDVYGELMDALHHARLAGLSGEEVAWPLQRALIEHLETIWREPDHGIWESRGPRCHYTHSKVMAWVAFDRTIKSQEAFGLDGPVEHWRAVRDVIRDDILTNGYDSGLGTFTQSYGSPGLDAALLLLPLVGFIEPSDARMKRTIEAIERDLIRNGFVIRYDTGSTEDGMSGDEGVFLACSFWLADNLLLLGRRQDAERLFERLLAARNDVGLLSEELDPATHRLLGNFPQALSHIGLVNTAMNLSRCQVRRRET